MRNGSLARLASSLLACVAGLAPALPGCAYTFDEAGVDIALRGDPVPPSLYRPLNEGLGPVRAVSLIQGAAATVDRDDLWVVMPQAQPEIWPPPETWPDTTRLVRVEDGTVETHSADQILQGGTVLYLLTRPKDGKTDVSLRIQRPGQAAPVGEFKLPPGDGLLLAASGDVAFAYIPAKNERRTFFLRRSDGSLGREIPLPAEVDPKLAFDKGRFFFDSRGEVFFAQDGEGLLVAHRTTAEVDRALGAFDRDSVQDSRSRTVVFCGKRGLVRLSLPALTSQTLDPSPCNPSILRSVSGSILYLREDGVYEVDDKSPPQRRLAAPVGQLLAVGPGRALAYSTDPPLTYGAGIGDGWLGSWRFMNRGRRPTWSIHGAPDAVRLRWMENAARSDGSGELLSARIAAAESERPLLLARNVRQWLEVAPGRVLAVSNAAGRGVYNRLILIDEDRREARWVLDSVRDFLRIPGRDEVIAQVVHGQIGFDIYRIPLPQGP
jgi:hypothetical protein